MRDNYQECDHTNLAIIALQQGGGIFPDVLVPELYCRDCSLNASLPTLIPADTRFGQGTAMFGIEIPSDIEKDIIKWINTYDDKNWIPVEEITRNPETTYKQASKYEGDLSGIKIIDKDKLESFCGK